MVRPFRRLLLTILILTLGCYAFIQGPTAYSGATTAIAHKSAPFAGAFDVKKFGAKGDGKALDSPAINKEITPQPRQVVAVSCSPRALIGLSLSV
ncbi:MAG TPA: hypothetical protein VJW17_02890, partial [Pyrinomonadaceae bacterium]|nr:hypothetical protein [Pyrinomonadaceae bacterium]